MQEIRPESCRFAPDKISDGSVFEGFSHSFLAAILGHGFIPVGGIKDKGIDGLNYVAAAEGNQKAIYQCSIEQDPFGKASRTLDTLKGNKIKFDILTYVTNQEFPDKDRAIEELSGIHKKAIQIYDVNWFAANVNSKPGSMAAFDVFVKGYLHDFEKPGFGFVVSDFVSDPRLYVFLRQQWDAQKTRLQLDEVLADTLILYALEGTDPDQGILRTRQEIIAEIAKHLKFEPKLLSKQIETRLAVLSSRKPNRRINHHIKQDAYCLPYETRKELVDKNLHDAALHQHFKKTITRDLARYLKAVDVRVQDCVDLIDSTMNKLFYKQGLEFADLVSNGYSGEAFEKSLPGTIAEVVDESSVIVKNRQGVKQALLLTIRDMVYRGTPEQKEYLRSLANTYMLLFLLQCDPKVSLFFSTMASKLDVYVCTSILVPALSEVCLEPQNRRYWNLLTGARAAGVKLRVNDTIVNELVAHFRKLRTVYEAEFSGNEDLYEDDISIYYVPEILIRAYLYSRKNDQVNSFDDFVDKFCSPDLRNAHRDLLVFLSEAFGIEFVPEASTGVKIEQSELSALGEALIQQKRDKNKALNDAKLILTIFALREKRAEASPHNFAGYKTWWLSSDTLTQRTVNKLFGDKYQVSCYMRPDFLYNYISLAPGVEVVSEVFKNVFPNLLGVNISHNLPSEVAETVRSFIKEHSDKGKPRLKAILMDLSDRLKTDPAYMSRAKVSLFLEEQKLALTGGSNAGE